MLTRMTEDDWALVPEVFDAGSQNAVRPDTMIAGSWRRSFISSYITSRALPAEFCKWNSVWKRFWRLSRAGVFETFFRLLA